MKQLEFFYDISSPYAYMAIDEVQRVASRTGAELVWRPFLFGGLFKHLGLTEPPVLKASPNKQRYYIADMFRWAELRRLPLNWPETFPINTVLPLRILLQLKGADHARMARRFFTAYWGDNHAINEPGVVSELLRAEGLDDKALLAGSQNPEVKALLRANTEEAFERGLCGAPTFFVGDLMFWGQDRLDMVERALNGWRPRFEQSGQQPPVKL